MAEGSFSENGEWRMENEENFFSSTGEEWRMEETSCAKVSPQSLSPVSILHGPQRGVTLSPWSSYPIGSSFSSFSILHSPRRCDNP
jgi:hypothetical protein